MPRQDRIRQSRGTAPAPRQDASSRREEKRSRFAGSLSSAAMPRRRRFTPGAILALVGVLLVATVVGVTVLGNSGVSSASAAPIQQVSATTAATDSGKVSISTEEVSTKKLVAWNYKKDNVAVPLLAYVTPSGATKVAVRMCEPCNSTSFHTEGDQLVCNACGSRWELESSKGIAGGCQGYPPELLPSSIVDGKIVVDEAEIASWKPRV